MMTFLSFSVKIPLMEAKILNQTEEYKWSDFVANHPLGNIHQTPEWGHFQSEIPGRGKYWIIVLEEADKIIAGALMLRTSLPHGYSWLYTPRGPLLTYENSEQACSQMNILLEVIKKIAKEEKAVFLRIDPLIEKSARADFNGEKTSETSHLGLECHRHAPLSFPHFRQNIHGFQPDHTLILDLTKSEDELLAQMKPKGRYNMRLAEKKGVKIRTSTPRDPHFARDLASFYRILHETTSRDGFHGHNQDFYKNMLESLGSDHSTLYLAEFEGKIIAASLNTFFGNTATYYYGASSNEHRNVMAPYLLHWQAIRDAKDKGYNFYDFFGIAPENAVNHPWGGVTDFKKKFGGTEISYQLPQEFIFKKTLYLLYHTYKKFQ